MQRLRRRIRHYARVDLPVLIHGPTGSGKELAARALHQLAAQASDGSAPPFVAVNCAHLPPTLATAELFGTEPGGFTGATRRPGLVRRAAGGTLFLDELAELDPGAQASLLRLLDHAEIAPVGGPPQRCPSFRLICATHRDLHALAHEGRFRWDLLYRVEGLILRTPPLSDRLSDLPVLLRHLATAPHRWSDAAIEALAHRPWPGHVRQLRQIIEAATLEATLDQGPDGQVLPHHLRSPTGPDERWPLVGLSLAEIKRRACVETLRAHNNNARAAARTLGISPTTLYTYL